MLNGDKKYQQEMQFGSFRELVVIGEYEG